MNVLFVHSVEDFASKKRPLPASSHMQFGISYISALLKQEGHRTRLVVPTPKTVGKVEEYIRDFDPGLVCFTSVFGVYEFLSDVARQVKKRHPDLFLAAGGTHITLNPDDCLDSAFDAVCVGEGEYPTLELVEQLEAGKHPSGIANLYIKNRTGVERNRPRPFIEDLDSLPFPDRAMWIPWFDNPLSIPSVLASRGCPFTCTYCCNRELSRLAEGRYVRRRSPGNIASEVRWIKEAVPGLEDIYLEAETLGINPEWALELCRELERLNESFEVPARYCANLRIRPNTNYDEMFDAFERSNFFAINVGLESGSERVRRDILKRYYSNEDIVRMVRSAKEHNLQVGFYNMIGIPGETPADFRETIRVNRECQPTWYLLSVFYPYPGTRLHETCVEMGLVDEMPDLTLERRRPSIELPGFSHRQIRRRFTWSFMLIYGGHRPVWEIAWRVFLTKVFAHRTMLRAWRSVQNLFSPYRKYRLEPPP